MGRVHRSLCDVFETLQIKVRSLGFTKMPDNDLLFDYTHDVDFQIDPALGVFCNRY